VTTFTEKYTDILENTRNTPLPTTAMGDPVQQSVGFCLSKLQSPESLMLVGKIGQKNLGGYSVFMCYAGKLIMDL
jgi:hypothetical protein